MSNENDAAPVDGMVIWRVRELSCDGGEIGRSWCEKFFTSRTKAEAWMLQRIAESDERNPRYLFQKSNETIDGVVGRCNWQFMTMLSVDSVDVAI